MCRQLDSLAKNHQNEELWRLTEFKGMEVGLYPSGRPSCATLVRYSLDDDGANQSFDLRIIIITRVD